MKNIDLVMSKPDTHRVLCTDFGATPDLFASEKDNSSVNNHAVLCIFFVLSNWRNVKYKKQENKWDETVVCDCDKWLVFGDTISQGERIIMYCITACLPTSSNFTTTKELQTERKKFHSILCTLITVYLNTSADRISFKLQHPVSNLAKLPSYTSFPKNTDLKAWEAYQAGK